MIRVINYSEWIRREADTWGGEQREFLESRFLPMRTTMDKLVMVSFNGSRWVQTVSDVRDDICRSPVNYTPSVYERYAGVFVRQGGVSPDMVMRGLVESLRKHYDSRIEDLRRERALLDEPLGEDECTHGEISDSATTTS